MTSDRAGNDTQPYFIGVDVGTGSARACVANRQGDLLSHASHDIQQWQSSPSCHEQSTADIWHSICIAVKAAVAHSKIDAAAIRSIALTATCSLAVFSNDTDSPMAMDAQRSHPSHNVILWMDRRAETEAAAMNRQGHELFRYLGGSISALMELAKVMWLKINTPGELFSKYRFFNLNDALTHLATGNATVPCTEACQLEQTALGVDGTIKGWSADFLATFGLEELAANGFGMVGGVCKHGRSPSAGDYVGQLGKQAALDLGLSPDVKVGNGIIDSYAGWVGTVGAHTDASPECLEVESPLEGRLSLVAGTSSCHIAASKEPVFVNGIWGPFENHVIPGFSMSAGGQNGSGQLFQYIIETHPAYIEALRLANSHHLSIYDFLNLHLHQMRLTQKAPSIPHLGRYFFFYGDLFGNRSPVCDPQMCGSVVGLTADKSVDSLAIHYYGVIEFLALQTRQIIAEMNTAGHQIGEIYMAGSQCQNELLVSILATACNMPVVTPQYEKAAVGYGAALLAAKAASVTDQGNTEDLWSIMQRLSKPGKVVRPIDDEQVRALIDVKYKVFLEQCERQRVFRSMVDSVTMSEKSEGG